ncbi:hypothetical protein [Microbulbifer discodermiae]|uniref:hypothetical protein n=1 Tax=Microbulbifer sp. 2201CG32-9 TaxID=3232309 RepID=UPI00345B7CCB
MDKRFLLISGLLLSALPGALAVAQTETDTAVLPEAETETRFSPLKGLTVDLNVTNSSPENISGLALEYTYKRSINGDYRQWGDDVAQLWLPRAKLEANGSVALVDENPQDFSNVTLDLGAEVQSFLSETAIYEVGAFYSEEGDEGFDNNQSVYGATMAFADTNTLLAKDDLVFRLSYGSVDPSGDEQRKQLLGDALEDFDRVHMRIEYSVRLAPTSTVKKVELTYNEYREMDAPMQIRDADLDQYTYSTIALYLPNNLALTFGKGSLPFDREGDRIVQLGYQMQTW